MKSFYFRILFSMGSSCQMAVEIKIDARKCQKLHQNLKYGCICYYNFDALYNQASVLDYTKLICCIVTGICCKLGPMMVVLAHLWIIYLSIFPKHFSVTTNQIVFSLCQIREEDAALIFIQTSDHFYETWASVNQLLRGYRPRNQFPRTQRDRSICGQLQRTGLYATRQSVEMGQLYVHRFRKAFKFCKIIIIQSIRFS